MNFSCPACQAKYFVKDDDVVGRNFKLACRRCNGTIPIQGRRRSDPVAPLVRTISSDRLRLSLPLELAAARAVAEVTESAPMSSVRPSLPPPLPLDVDVSEFYVGIGGLPVGPLDLDEVTRRAELGDIGPRTYVWRPGLAAWQRLAAVDELAHLSARLALPPPALPGPPPAPAAQTLEERLGFGYLGDAPALSQPDTPRAEKRVKLSAPTRKTTRDSEWRSLFVGLVISLAVGVALGALL